MPNYNLSGKPTGKRVLVFPDPAESVTKGGIIIPETAKEVPLKGRVIQVGPEVVECKGGDEVLYGKYSGTNITFAAMSEDKEVEVPAILMLESDLIYVWPCEIKPVKPSRPVRRNAKR
jgi:chaperonin GroES